MEETRYNIKEAAEMIGVSAYTISNWYRWFESDLLKPPELHLPEYTRGNHGGKLFTKRAINSLVRFRENLPRGAMSQFNACYNWGKRGLRALKNKNILVEDIRSKIMKGINECEQSEQEKN